MNAKLRIVLSMAFLMVFVPNTYAQVSAEKQSVLDWLSQPDVVTQFGEISDRIWTLR